MDNMPQFRVDNLKAQVPAVISSKRIDATKSVNIALYSLFAQLLAQEYVEIPSNQSHPHIKAEVFV